MKTQNYSSTRRVRRTLTNYTAILALSLFAISTTQAQLPGKADNQVNAIDNGIVANDISMSQFTARSLDGTVYLNWYMKGESSESVFLVERSVNGGVFESIGFKDGYPAPDATTELLYSYSDTQPALGITRYRIKQYKQDGIFYGQELSVIIQDPLPIVQSRP